MTRVRDLLFRGTTCLLLILTWGLPVGLCGGLIAGCDDHPATTGPQPQSGLRVVQMKIGSRDFSLEVADRDQSRETGLMYRDAMADDHGMIFVFPDEDMRLFYMANTRIPLDIAFLDSGGTVVSVKSMLPLDLRTTSSEKPAKYAIEMNAGAAAAIGLKAGDRLVIPAEAANPTTQSGAPAPG
jgi:uncharacterized membrane protein (UPF0127 family)